MGSDPNKQMIPVSHLTDADFKKWNSNCITEKEMEHILEHTAFCSRCASLFLQRMETLQDDSVVMEVPPAYLEDEILHRCHQPDVKLTRTLIDTGSKVQLWLYGLKITTAVVLSIMMLFHVRLRPDFTDRTMSIPRNPFSITKLQELPDDYNKISEDSETGSSTIMKYLRDGSMSLNQNLQNFSDDFFPFFPKQESSQKR